MSEYRNHIPHTIVLTYLSSVYIHKFQLIYCNKVVKTYVNSSFRVPTTYYLAWWLWETQIFEKKKLIKLTPRAPQVESLYKEYEHG